MNRKIKFRSWNPVLNRMSYGKDLQRIGFQYQDLTDSWSVLNTVNGSDVDEVLMQFTGLYDKNGKEIYEGDVLKGVFRTGSKGFPSTKEKEFSFPVKFYPSSGWNLETKFKNGKFRFYPHIEECEIIGNIYENKQL